MKFSIYNLGCKVNACEAESISEALSAKGWTRSIHEEDSDAVLIFTCAVTNTASAKSRQMLHKARHANPKAVTAVVGCYAQMQDGLLDDADIIVGSSHKNELPDLLEQFQQTGEKIRVIEDLKETPFESMPLDHFEDHSRGVLKIQDGCNQFCTYCIIPYVRGRERSLDPDTAVANAERVAQNDSEIVLTGIHTGRYGKEYNVSLAQLMKRILKEVPALERLRISSIEMTEVSDELIQLIKEEPRIAHHLHIPLQSGCDEILQKMGRPYDTAAYYAKIEQIRREIPHIAISCDVIVGFPGESEEMFEKTYAFLEKCKFAFLHVFPYSLREGTRAAAMAGQIDPKIKKERAEKCRRLSMKLEDAYQQAQIGRMAEVITERPHGNDTPGHTSDYIHVVIPGQIYSRGSLVQVRLKEYRSRQMIGETESVKNDEVI
jgi:threonylcarbamoyladenosine tRNA methylthiotransferase MtaB